MIDSRPLEIPATSPVLLAGDREPGLPSAAPSRCRHWLAVVAAAALHLAPLLPLLALWLSVRPHEAPPAIPVSLVFKPPTPPPPAPPARPAPQPGLRRSGQDAETRAPPPPSDRPPAPTEAAPTEAPTPDAAAAVPPDQPPGTQQQTANLEPPAAAPPVPSAKPTHRRAAKPPSKWPAETTLRGAAPGERVMTGDAYLNAIVAQMSRHYSYPEIARPLALAGTAVFALRLDRAGRIVSLRLVKSAGAEVLDREGARIIRSTEPFPPPPADIPGSSVGITIEMPIAPP